MSGYQYHRFCLPALALLLAQLMGACAGPAPTAPPALPASPTPEAELLLDDFENELTPWQAGRPPTYADSSAQAVELTSEYVGRGRQALALRFEKSSFPKAIFFVEGRWDMSSMPALRFELFNDGAASGVGLALCTGSSWEWHESEVVPLQRGAQTITFDLRGDHYKTAATQWQYRTSIANLQQVMRIAIIVYPETSGSVSIDALRLSNVAAPQVWPTITPLPSATPLPAVEATTLIVRRLTPESIGIYGRLELEIVTDGVVANPYDPAQTDLWVRFTAPSGKVMRVPAFWYQDFDPQTLMPEGEGGWRVRFTPTEAGEWTAQAELVRPALTGEPLAFTVTPEPAARGFVRLHPANSRYFAFDNGEFYLPIGLNIGWSVKDVLAEYTRWFDRLAQNGGNVARVWMASWSFGLEWRDTGLGNYTNRMKQAWLLDRVFELAEERHIYIMLTLLNHGAYNTVTNPEWADNPYNAALGGPCAEPQDFVTNPLARDYFKRRLRYIAARWAYSSNLFAWEWWNEINWTPINDDLLAAWLDEMTPELQKYDPYDHLVSISYASGTATKIWSRPDLDFSQQHDYSGRDPLVEFRLAYNAITATAPDKPLLMAEQGYSSAGADAQLIDRDLCQLHNGIWGAPFIGYAGSAMYWWWDTLIDPLELWPEYKGLAVFMAGEDLSTLTPGRGMIEPADAKALTLQAPKRALVWVRSDKYEAAAVGAAFTDAVKKKENVENWRYNPPLLRGLTLTVTGLDDGAYTAEWYYPATAAWGARMSAQSTGGILTVPVPDLRTDLAVRITPAE